jgi:predicted DsbA family dithiol-disulfide isomerase
MHIDIVADVACPWCYIGKRRLERALALRPEMVATWSWRPFQLNPDLPDGGIPRDFFLAAKFGAMHQAVRNHSAIAAAGRAEGIGFAFERIERTPNTLRAHRLIRLAAAAGRGDALAEALFAAYFTAGVDIGDIGTLARLAAQNGIDRNRALAYLESAAGTAEVLAEERRARRLGIHAVPCFVIERSYAISGAQEPEMLLPLFDLAAGIGNRASAPA